MRKNREIKNTTRKITIHTLDLVDRGKWINPELECKYIKLNFTFPSEQDYPVRFTSMGWDGISTVTVDLQGLRDAGENIDNPHNAESYLYDLEKLYKKYATPKTDTEPATETTPNAGNETASVKKPETETTPNADDENSEVLVWFEKKKKSRYSRNDVKVDAVPENAIKLDSKKHRYQVERGTIYKYAAQKSGGYMKQNFGNASFAPAAVIAALQQLQGQGRVSVSD